jgi:hypothetical protein
MPLISQFATHFWGVGVWVVGYNRGYFSLYYLNSKRRRVGILVGRGQSAEYRVQTTAKYNINISDRIFILLYIV